MKRIIVAGVFLLLVALILGACSREPQTYEDCVLETMEGSGKSDTAAQLIALACREKFPLEEAESLVPHGRFFYATEEARCRETNVTLGRRTMWSDGVGFCADGSRFEVSPAGDVTLACLNYKARARTVIFEVALGPEGAKLSQGDELTMFLHTTLAACERSITDEDREAAEQFHRVAMAALERVVDERKQQKEEEEQRRQREEAEKRRQREEAPSLPSGDYYYKTSDADCRTIAFASSGILVPGRSGFCDPKSRLELSASGAVTLTCLDFNRAGRNTVYDVRPMSDGLALLTDDGKPLLVLYSRLAACERSVTEADRQRFGRVQE